MAKAKKNPIASAWDWKPSPAADPAYDRKMRADIAAQQAAAGRAAARRSQPKPAAPAAPPSRDLRRRITGVKSRKKML